MVLGKLINGVESEITAAYVVPVEMFPRIVGVFAEKSPNDPYCSFQAPHITESVVPEYDVFTTENIENDVLFITFLLVFIGVFANSTPGAEYVGFTLRGVASFPFPLLSFQTLTLLPLLNVILDGSAASSHNAIPGTLRGSNPKTPGEFPAAIALLEHYIRKNITGIDYHHVHTCSRCDGHGTWERRSSGHCGAVGARYAEIDACAVP
jgi:hypothetical protein